MSQSYEERGRQGDDLDAEGSGRTSPDEKDTYAQILLPGGSAKVMDWMLDDEHAAGDLPEDEGLHVVWGLHYGPGGPLGLVVQVPCRGEAPVPEEIIELLDPVRHDLGGVISLGPAARTAGQGQMTIVFTD